MEKPFKYTDLSDFISKTFVALDQDGKAVIILARASDFAVSLPGFKADPEKSDMEIWEEGFNYWKNFDAITSWLCAEKEETTGFKIRDCQNCNSSTAQEQRPYDPDDENSFMVWYCTKCKESLDIV